MKALIKNLISFILPVVVGILVPYWIERSFTIRSYFFFILGAILIVTGLLIMIHTISLFIRIGKGTLAPWSPTKKLVIAGMYKHIRNPMILGVFIILLGESIAFTSVKIFIWAIIFFVINNLYFAFYEEPNLERRFGEEYREYKRNVHRWIPRLKNK